MVDPIGYKPITPPGRAVAPVAPGVRAAAPRTAPEAETDGAAAAALTVLSRELAASPPVDSERVARIRQAIAAGDFPILPETIADRMLALKLDWRPDDAA